MSHWNPEDDALLRRARAGGTPDADDHARVKRAIFAHLGLGLGATTSTAAAAGASAAVHAPWIVAATKVGVAVALLGAVGAGTVAVRRSLDEPKAKAVVVASAPAIGVGPAQAPLAPPSLAPSGLAAPAPRAAVVPAMPPSPREAPSPRSTSVPRAPPAPAAPSAARPTESARGPEPEAATPAATSAIAAVPPIAAPPPPAPPPAAAPDLGPATVGAEAALLGDADAALRAGNPGRALALLDAHASRFPNGILVEERDAERIVVLCALGRTAEARAAATVFLGQRPRSPLAARIRASCAGAGD